MNIIDTPAYKIIKISLTDKEMLQLFPSTVVDYRFDKFRIGLLDEINSVEDVKFLGVMINQIKLYIECFVEYDIQNYSIDEIYYDDYATHVIFKGKISNGKKIQRFFRRISGVFKGWNVPKQTG